MLAKLLEFINVVLCYFTYTSNNQLVHSIIIHVGTTYTVLPFNLLLVMNSFSYCRLHSSTSNVKQR